MRQIQQKIWFLYTIPLIFALFTLACSLSGIRQPLEAEPEQLSIHIIGQVKDATTGDPLAASLFGLNDSPTQPLLADQDGRFEFSLMIPKMTLRAEMPGYEVFQRDLDLNQFSTQAAPVSFEIILTPKKLSGVIMASDTHRPLAQVTVTAGPESRPLTTTTAPDGTFELLRLEPGALVSIQPLTGYLSTEITYQEQKHLSLALPPRVLTMTVQHGFSAEPAVGAAIAFNQTLTTTTNAQGQATLSHISATGQLSVTQAGYEPTTLDYKGEEVLEITLVPAGLQGVIRDSQTNLPLPRATLYLTDTIIQADDNGRFSLETLPISPTQLMVKAAGYHRSYAQIAQTGLVTGTTPPPFSGAEGRWLTTTPCAQPQPTFDFPCVELLLEPFEVRAIYIPFNYLRSYDFMIAYLDFVAETELNAIIVDVKGDFGFLGWESEVALAETVGANEEHTETWLNLADLVTEAKKRNVYTIARFVVFKDDPLAHVKPELAVVSDTEADTVWLDGEDLGWANPFKEEVWDYNIALAQEVAAFGFDEINFDYIRFPSDGDIGAIVYEEENTAETRTAAIREFITRMSEALRPYGIFTSVDVFGLTVWVTPESDMQIGQRVIDLAPHIDYLAPMIYPSTFVPGNLGYADPSAEPYGVIFNSQNEAETRVPPYVKVRPWLQAYWYSLEEMQLQKQAAEEAGSSGWSWWNAAGRYEDELFEGDAEE